MWTLYKKENLDVACRDVSNLAHTGPYATWETNLAQDTQIHFSKSVTCFGMKQIQKRLQRESETWAAPKRVEGNLQWVTYFWKRDSCLQGVFILGKVSHYWVMPKQQHSDDQAERNIHIAFSKQSRWQMPCRGVTVSICNPGPFQRALPPLWILTPKSGRERRGKSLEFKLDQFRSPGGMCLPPCSESGAWRAPKLHHLGSCAAAKDNPSSHRRACQPWFLGAGGTHQGQGGERGMLGQQGGTWDAGEEKMNWGQRGYL